jgi:hypothetical protein
MPAFFSGLVVGLFIGAFLGLVTMCIMTMASDREVEE